MRLLIDHDILLHRALWGCKGGYYQQLQTCDYMLEKIMDRLDSTDVTLIISGDSNFRKEISSTYKANRDPSQRPQYLYDAKQYYIRYWGAVVSEEMEADDVIGMAHDEESIVVSSDKDMMQLGGLIYNPVKNELYDIQNPWYFFYKQMLTGDKADNIEGIKNPLKAHHKAQPNFTEETAREVLMGKECVGSRSMVEALYRVQYGEDWFDHFDMNARLLFLKRANAEEYYEVF